MILNVTEKQFIFIYDTNFIPFDMFIRHAVFIALDVFYTVFYTILYSISTILYYIVFRLYCKVYSILY